MVGHYDVSGAAHAFRYSTSTGLVDIHPAGYIASLALAISDQGVAVGWALLPTGRERAARWAADNSFTDLGAFGAQPYAVAYAVNNSGLIVGETHDAQNNFEPFSWTASSGMVVVHIHGSAYGISDRGRAVGHANGFGGTRKGNGPILKLPTFPGDVNSIARAVNRCGNIAGVGSPPAGPMIAKRWTISACDP